MQVVAYDGEGQTKLVEEIPLRRRNFVLSPILTMKMRA